MLKMPRFPPFILTLVVGVVGGAVAAAVNLPLAWMLGALWVIVLLSVWKTLSQPPQQLRRLSLAVIGCYLGSSFTPTFLNHLVQAPVALVLTTLATAFTFAAGFFVLKRALNADNHTALFGSMPGGLSLLIALASTYRGDTAIVVTVQVVRIMSVASIIPLWSRFVAGDDAVVAGMAAAEGIESYGLWWLLAAFFAAAGAQVVLGASVGARLGVRELMASGKTAVVGVAMAILFLAICALFAAVAASVTDIRFLVWLLAFAPGGIAEICLVAQLLDLNPMFVLTMQVARLLLVVIFTPLLARWLQRGVRRGGY